jgi:predicted NBD/HSP70 family sugar kinase
MFYVGLDIHDKRIAICVLSDTGQVVRRAQVRTIDEMVRILQGLSIASRSATRPVAATATTMICFVRSRRGSPSRIRVDYG